MVIMETIVLFWLTGYYDRYSTSSDQRPSRTHRDSDDTLLGQRTQPEAINEWGQKHYESSNEGIVPLHGTTNYHFISVCVYSKEMNYSICFLRNSVKFRFFMMWFTPSQITMNLLLSPHCFEFFLHTEIWGVCFKQNDLKRLKAEIFTFFCFVLYHQNESDIWDRLPWRSLIINCQRYLATLKTQVPM